MHAEALLSKVGSNDRSIFGHIVLLNVNLSRVIAWFRSQLLLELELELELEVVVV